MDKISAFPDKPIPKGAGVVSEQFLRLRIKRFVDACQYVHKLPYGYNSDSDDLMILFKEEKGTCTTKHAVIAALAEELSLPITKTIGIYPMTEELVSGTNPIIDKYRLPYVPMLHCFLQGDHYRVDLTEGNRNGKNKSIEDFLYTEKVRAGITKREEYLLYRRVLKEVILGRDEMEGVDLKTVLKAREEGLKVLKSNLNQL